MYNQGMSTALSRDFLARAAMRARLCKHLYIFDETPPPPGWSLLATSDEIHPNSTGFFAAIYQRNIGGTHGQEKETVIAIRGLNDGEDLKSIFSIFSRRLPVQFNDTVAFIDKACEKYGLAHNKIELVGHSLGGYLARTVSRVRDFQRSWCFGGPGPDEKTQAALTELHPSRLPRDCVINVRSRFDIVALFGPDEKNTIELDTPFLHHDVAHISYALARKAGVRYGQSPLLEPAKGAMKRLFNPVSKMLTCIASLRGLIKKLSTYDADTHLSAKPLHILKIDRTPQFPPKSKP